MSEHITGNEFKQYFAILLAGTPNEDDADFINDIQAHVVKCDCCSEKMRAVRLLLQGFSSDPDLAEELVNIEFPETMAKPAFNLQKVFAGVRLAKIGLAGEIRMLADTLSDRINAAFIPNRFSLGAVRGDGEPDLESDTLNDLLCSDMEITLEDGRRIVLRCRRAGASGQIRLFVYSNFKADFLLASGGEILSPLIDSYDRAANEYVRLYELDGEVFELTAR